MLVSLFSFGVTNKHPPSPSPTHYPPKKMNYLLSHDFAHYLLITNPSQTTHNTHTHTLDMFKVLSLLMKSYTKLLIIKNIMNNSKTSSN